MSTLGALEAGAVHLWLGSLDRDDATLARLRQHLSEEEERRAGRLLDREVARRLMTGRGLLREILSGYLNAPPASLNLSVAPGGKPFLAGSDWRLSFNISHSDGLFIVAVAAGRKVGVDLELIRSDLDFAPLARTCFSATEQHELFHLPPDQQLPAFYRCWTRKEAYLKGTGTGFSRSSDIFDVTLLPGIPAALTAHRGDADEAGRWRLADLAVPSGYCAALALEARPFALEYFTFSA